MNNQSPTCLITAVTHSPSGRKLFMARKFDGSGDLFKSALESILKRRDRGAAFLGCGVDIETPFYKFSVILESNLRGMMLTNENNETLAEESHS